MRRLCHLALLPILVSSASAQEEIVRGEDRFAFTYQAKLPVIQGEGRAWLPVARSDESQQVTLTGMKLPEGVKAERLANVGEGNEVLTFQVGAAHSGQMIELGYTVVRKEKSAYEAVNADAAAFLKPDRLVPVSKQFKTAAQDAVKRAESAQEKGRALYYHVLERMKYDKTGEGWGRGDAMHACEAGTGNCTDFHAYFIALARSIGLPARFAIGFTIPAHEKSGGITGYHCWAEFLADGKWVPVDISEADKHPALASYYFGHHPANRFELTRGRDLAPSPLPAGGLINFLVYPFVEVNGRQVKTENTFTYRRS